MTENEKRPGVRNLDLPLVSAEEPAPASRPSVRKKPGGKRVLIVVAAAVALVLVGGAIWLFAGSGSDFFDENAVSGQAPYKSAEEMQAELDRMVEEGMFNISISSLIEFENGTAPGKAYIENVPGNRYVMQVTITLDDTGETAYESKGIKPGNYIEDIALMNDLEPGDYAATATFSALDPESLEEIGKAAAKVTLSVQG